MRTQEEIIQRIKSRKDADFFGFETGDYLVRLTAENAKAFCKPDADLSDWEQQPLDREAILKEMADYLSFAWGKANDCRGISANRSIMHYIAWTWLAGDTDISDAIIKAMDERYEYYGKPILARICEHYGWNWREHDDGTWTNTEDGAGVVIENILERHPPLKQAA